MTLPHMGVDVIVSEPTRQCALAAGCERIFAEKVSGKSTNGRHQLEKAVRALQPGDRLVTVRLDRLARSIRDLLHLLDQVKAAGATLQGAR